MEINVQDKREAQPIELINVPTKREAQRIIYSLILTSPPRDPFVLIIRKIFAPVRVIAYLAPQNRTITCVSTS